MEPGSGLGVALRPAHPADNQRKDEAQLMGLWALVLSLVRLAVGLPLKDQGEDNGGTDTC